MRDYIYLDNTPFAVKVYGGKFPAGIYYFLNDHLGTPQQLVDSNGVIVWQAAYYPFGKAQVVTETVTNPLHFPGQYYDAKTRLHYNWNRYYDPETGRYISADPIGSDEGINLYTYVENDSVNWIDPMGLRFFLPPYLDPEVDAFTDAFEDLGRTIITETADAYENCVHCAVKCTLGVAFPSEATGAVIRQILKEGAKDLARAALKKVIPYYNVADLIVTGGMMASCVVDCKSGE